MRSSRNNIKRGKEQWKTLRMVKHKKNRGDNYESSIVWKAGVKEWNNGESENLDRICTSR